MSRSNDHLIDAIRYSLANSWMPPPKDKIMGVALRHKEASLLEDVATGDIILKIMHINGDVTELREPKYDFPSERFMRRLQLLGD